MHILEGGSYVDSFYFISMLATTQGPADIPKTTPGHVFASLFAFISVGAVLSAIVFMFGPLMGTAFKKGIDYVEKEEAKLKFEQTRRPEEEKTLESEAQSKRD